MLLWSHAKSLIPSPKSKRIPVPLWPSEGVRKKCEKLKRILASKNTDTLGIVEVPAYISCFFMMESPKLGRKKSTAAFYAGNTAACGLGKFFYSGNSK